jgi:hypothetical protein
MDAHEFDRLVAGARNPQLIPGIYNYCDGRCPRCPFTERCLTYLDTQELKAGGGDGRSPAHTVEASLSQTLELIRVVARREGLDAGGLRDDEEDVERDGLDRHRRDPLAARAREYGHFAWRIGRAIAPIAAARDDAPLVDAIETIEWFSSLISSKLYRAICGQADGWERPDEAQTDFNGSAKIALIGIRESRRAWAVLMEAGRATADGVPAQAVRILEELDTAVCSRFPRVMEFVRPGFDEPEVAEGGTR